MLSKLHSFFALCLVLSVWLPSYRVQAQTGSLRPLTVRSISDEGNSDTGKTKPGQNRSRSELKPSAFKNTNQTELPGPETWSLADEYPVTPVSGKAPGRYTVFVIPGTFSSNSKWGLKFDDQVNFLSELKRGLGKTCRCHYHLWSGKNQHADRVLAARELAKKINAADPECQVILIGHSHGGNIAMLAAEQTTRDIEAIICLSTPFIFYRATDQRGRDLDVPIYCSSIGRKKINHLIAITSQHDKVVDSYSAVQTGLDPTQLRNAASKWTEESLRLEEKNIFSGPIKKQQTKLARSLGQLKSKTRISHQLSIADANMILPGDPSRLGVEPHKQIHSRRMGFLLGMAVRNRLRKVDLDYIATTYLTASDDVGDPVTPDEHEDWTRANLNSFGKFGRVLCKVQTEVDPDLVSDGPLSGEPDIEFNILDRSGDVIFRSTEISSTTPVWHPGFLLDLNENLLVLREIDPFSRTQLGGAVRIDPARNNVLVESRPFWKTRLLIQTVHR